jgi:site-specific DNA-methyltransferase (adenine-specific)
VGDHVVYVVTFRPLGRVGHDASPARRLALVLKFALRAAGLRCLHVEERSTVVSMGQEEHGELADLLAERARIVARYGLANLPEGWDAPPPPPPDASGMVGPGHPDYWPGEPPPPPDDACGMPAEAPGASVARPGGEKAAEAPAVAATAPAAPSRPPVFRLLAAATTRALQDVAELLRGAPPADEKDGGRAWERCRSLVLGELLRRGVNTRPWSAPAGEQPRKAGKPRKGLGVASAKPAADGAAEAPANGAAAPVASCKAPSVVPATTPPVPLLGPGERWRLSVADCLVVMPALPAGYADCVYADPPFNIDLKYRGYADNLPREEYREWTRRWLAEARRVLSPTGMICVQIDARWAGLVQEALEDLGLHFRNCIVWYYAFGMHQGAKFGRDHQVILCYAADPQRFTFNADAVRVPSDRQLKYRDKRANPLGRVPGDVWPIPRVCGTFKRRKKHACQTPDELLDRLVLAYTDRDDLVLDPFAGSGSAGAAALRHGRRYLGIELVTETAEEARQTLTRAASVAQAPSGANGAVEAPGSASVAPGGDGEAPAAQPQWDDL